MSNTTAGLGGYDVIERYSTDPHKVVKIAPNGADRIAVFYIAGSAVRSKTFKTLKGAFRWAASQGCDLALPVEVLS